MSQPSRRDCLAFAGSSVLLAGLPRLSFAAPPKRTLRKAVGWGMIGGDASVLDKFLFLRDLGFDGVELPGPSDLRLDEVRAALEKSQLQVSEVVDSVHWGDVLNSPDAAVRERGRKGLEAALRDAKAYGCDNVLLVPAVVDGAKSYDEAWTLSQAEIKKTLPLAAELGVVIAVENVWNNFLLSPLEAARYVDEFQSPWVRFFFDVGNVVTYGWPDQWVKILGPRISRLHIKDYSRKKRDELGRWQGFECELLEGDADYPAVMRALDAIGYSTSPKRNWATAEVGGGDRTRLKQIADQMNTIFAS